MAPFYVALCHIRPRTGLTEPVMEKLVSIIKNGGGMVRKVNNSGVRPLPTEMRGKGVAEFHKFASIASVEFMANPQLAISATQQVRGFDDVIRLSLLRADELLMNAPPRPTAKTMAEGDGSASPYISRYDRAPLPPRFKGPREPRKDKPRISLVGEGAPEAAASQAQPPKEQ